MAWSGTLCTSADVDAKVGSGVSASVTEAFKNSYVLAAESYINVLANYNFTDNYAGLNADVKYILGEACSNLCAIYAVMFDMSGYNSTRQAENIINICWQRFNQCIKLLNVESGLDFLKNA